MKLHNHKILTIFTFIMFLTIGAFTAMLYIFPSSNTTTSALTYQTESSMSFTFSPMISINVSSSTIDIPTLAPGTTAESDPITVTVATNTAYGYSLYADVGNSTDYNTDSLVHSSNDNNSNNNDNSNNVSSTPSVFTSIATNASLSQLTTDNTWGYSYKPSTESTWSSYNGLPLYTTTEDHTSTTNPALLIDTKDAGDSSKSIDFKIAAKSSSTQPSGIYSNVINFYAVGKPEPIDLATAFARSGAQKTEQGYYRMQDMTTDICDSVEMIHSTIRLQDVRDNNVYTVAKLKDGNCWMTENLNLTGGTEITSELSDVLEGYVLPTSNGFQSGNRLPESTQSVPRDGTQAYLYNTGNVTSNCSEPGCYSYYSWVAATAGSGLGSSSSTEYMDAPYSICPSGWRMPTTRNDNSLLEYSDFYKLTAAYGNNTNQYYQNSSSFYSQAGPNTVPKFLRASRYTNQGFSKPNENYDGFIWTATSTGNASYYFIFVSFAMNSASSGYGDTRAERYPVRCLAR